MAIILTTCRPCEAGGKIDLLTVGTIAETTASEAILFFVGPVSQTSVKLLMSVV